MNTFFQLSSDLLCVASSEGCFLELNPAWEITLGYTIKELKSLPFFDFVHPDDIGLTVGEFAKELEGHGNINFVNRFRCREGSYKWLEWRGTLSGDKKTVFFIARDISERKIAEEAYKSSEEEVKRERILLRTLIDNLPDTIYIKDIDGRKVIANNADWTLMGFSSEAEVIGKTDLEVFDNEIGMRGYKDDMAVLRNEQSVINHEEDFIDPNGNQCWLYTTKMPLHDEAGNVLGLVGIGRNITERKKAGLQLEKQAEELKDLNATKDKFFSIIAHDLKNPFHAILGYSNILIEDFRRLDPEDIEQMLKVLVKQSNLAYNLLENLLLWARSQTRRLEIKPEKIDLFSMILDNISLLRGQAGKKNLQLVPNIHAPCEGYADAKMVDTVIRNLLSNATKFTPVDGKIVVSAVRLNDEIEISIRDTGVGIPEKNLDNIFKLDSKTNTVGTENETGTGLGLILCKEFVEKNGGRIWVESEVGKGSTFRFTVPV